MKELRVSKYFWVFLFTAGVVALANLAYAYKHESLGEAIIAIICWLIVAPLVAIWWYGPKGPNAPIDKAGAEEKRER